MFTFDSRKDFYALEKTLKNQLFNKSLGEKPADRIDDNLSDLDRARRKLDSNATVSKKFPFKPEQYKYPESALNIGNPLYMTANKDYGRLKPTEYEIHSRWYPRSNNFTDSVPGGPYENNSLRTEITKSKVHDYLDGFN